MASHTLDALRGLVVYAHVAETKSFSRAAERLGMTKSAVSKHIAQLERELNVQLLVRTTRKLALTEVGERVYGSSARIAAELEGAHEAAQTHSAVVTGVLRITAPSGLGRTYLMPLVAEFLARHPQVSVELLLGDTFADLVDDRIDLALRVGGRPDQSLVMRRIAALRFLVVAAPGYLARRGEPRTPEELSQHEWVMHLPSSDPGRFTLKRGKRTVRVRILGRIGADDGPANVAAARAGCGLLVVPDFEVGQELREGSLVPVLSAWRVDDEWLSLVFPPRKHVSGKVRAFADLIVERWRTPPWRTA